MAIKLFKPPLLKTNLQLNRLPAMRPLKLRPLPRRIMRLLDHIRRASLNRRSQRIPRGNSSQHNRREDLHCSNWYRRLRNRCRQQRARPVPPSKPCQLFKLLRSSAQTRVIQLHGTLATLGQGAPSGRTIVKRIVHACRSTYRRNSLDWIAIACGTSKARQSLHRDKLSVAKLAKTTVGLSITHRDSSVVCDNANSDVHKGGV